MTIADKLTLLANTKEQIRQTLKLPTSMPFSEYYKYASPYNPVTLFAAGQQGAIYDPSDLTTLWQDAAGTVPVTKSGDPVALMRDKSGNNNHARQTLSASRPTYQTNGILHWLAFDGVDDFMTASSVVFGGTAFTTVWGLTEKTVQYGGFEFRGGGLIYYQEYAAQSNLNISLQSNYQRVGWAGGIQESNVRPSTLNTPFVSYVRNGATFRRGNIPASIEKNLGFVDFRLSPACDLIIGKGHNDFVSHMNMYGFVWVNTDINNSDIELVKNFMTTKTGVTV